MQYFSLQGLHQACKASSGVVEQGVKKEHLTCWDL